MSHAGNTTPKSRLPGWLSLPPMRYPNAYVWFVFFSAMDVMLTWAILARKGREVNPVASAVIDYWGERGDMMGLDNAGGLWGAMAFKFCLMLIVILVCEIVGRRKPRTGRYLSVTAVVISALPVVYSLGLLTWDTLLSGD